jgi:Glutaredoxin
MRTCRDNITIMPLRRRAAAIDMQVVIFSKSYCPFCAKAKRAIGSVIDMSKVTVLEVRPSCCACNMLTTKRGGAEAAARRSLMPDTGSRSSRSW